MFHETNPALFFLTWVGIFVLVGFLIPVVYEVYPTDLDFIRQIALLAAFVCLAINYILWFLVAFSWKLLCLAISKVLRIPSDLLNCYKRFWEKWTLSSQRFGWRTQSGFHGSKTPLLSEAGCSHDCQSTSKLCQNCYHIIEQSHLISGVSSLFTRRTEWHKWIVPVHGSAFRTLRGSCQLCHILWSSLDEDVRIRLAGPYISSRQSHDVFPWLWLSIREDKNSLWSKTGLYYLSLYDGDASRPDHYRILCYPIEVKEEQLGGQLSSVHVPTWTGDCFELAKTWITCCQLRHKSHCSMEVMKKFEEYLPARLLYVGGNNSTVLRLEETCSPGFTMTDRKYIALSYFRSQIALPAFQRLSLDNKNEWKSQISENELPLTFQHAIQLTRKLDLNYLWIDALCVVQDCPEDRNLESNNMGKVFAGAYCTIASYAEANGGCFSKRNSAFEDIPCHVRFSKRKAMTIRAHRHTYNPNSFAEEVDDKNLSWQSWGFQERILSSRILHFGPKFLFFECNTHIASEVTPAGQPFREKRWSLHKMKPQLQSNTFRTTFNPVNGYRNSFHQLRANRFKRLSEDEEFFLSAHWAEIIFKLTSCKHLGPSDRADAILGLAQAIQNGNVDLEYRHGLWQRHLLFDLLWLVESGKRKKKLENRTRSWSWQTIDGIVSNKLLWNEKKNHGQLCKWTKVAVLLATDDDEGLSSQALMRDHILLKCSLLPCMKIFPSVNGYFILQLQTPEGGVEARFAPDFLDFDQQSLIGAEILRQVVFETAREKQIKAIWSHGLVLQRSYVPNGQDLHIRYERVGRFWMEWPLMAGPEGGPRPGNLARTILGRKNVHLVKIE